MPLRQIILIILVGLGLLALILDLVRRHMLIVKYALIWLFVAFIMLTVPLFFNFYLAVANLFGIEDSSSLFFFMGIGVALLFVLQFSIVISSAYYDKKALTQHLALLDERVRMIEGALARVSSLSQGPISSESDVRNTRS